jgi:hypothetical protein
MRRLVLVCDEHDNWYLRELSYNVETPYGVVYHCDKHLGGPWSFDDALKHLRRERYAALWGNKGQ